MKKLIHILPVMLALAATAPVQTSAQAPVATSTAAPQADGGGSSPVVTGTRNPSDGAPIRGRRRNTTPAPAANNDINVTGSLGNTTDPSAFVYGSTVTGGIPNAPEKLPLLDVARPQNPLGIKAGTPIVVRIDQPIDSAHAKNGQIIHGTLVNAVGSAPAGAPVELTVVAAAAVGQMYSYGELSIQVIGINGHHVLSNVITAEGKEGPKITADSAPGKGTEAVFTPDQPITLPAA